MHPSAAAEQRQALRYLRAGEAKAAANLAHNGLLTRPSDPQWLSILGLALSADKRAQDALPVYESLVELQSSDPAHWSNLGNCLCELGREHEALPALLRAQSLGADDAAMHFGLARAFAVVGPARTGLLHADRAVALAPDDAEFRLLRAKFLIAIDEWSAANLEIDHLLMQPIDTPQRIDLGYLLLRGGLYSDAEALFAGVLMRTTNDADARLGLISTLERINRVDDAVRERAMLETQLTADPDARLHEKLLQVDARLAARRGDHQRACDDLTRLLSRAPADPTLRISLRFDLGAALDKCGQPDEAMAVLAQAHAERRALVNDDHPALARDDNIYIALEEPPPPARPLTGLPDSDVRLDPVWVVGFPRSGTTLLEQLLDAHSGLASFDEQPFVQRLVKGLYARGGTLREAMEQLDARDVQSARDRYFDDVARVLPQLGTRRPVDKNPLNLVRLPLLPYFFPRSRVVLAVRHPCDAVLSCYMQHFQAPSFAMTFETLDTGAEMYDRVFSHWESARDAFGLPVHTLRYEDLVADTEMQARRLFEFLDLDWQPQVMDFTERARSKGAISTPSYSQVVEQVNARSVGRWQAYFHHFSDGARARLAPWVEHFGYPALPQR